MITFGSFFSGIGGIDLAFMNAGFNIKWANDIDEKVCAIYRSNFNHPILHNDINVLSMDNLCKVDIITAGFPCQAFSIAGKRGGFSDARGNLFFSLLSYIKQIQPKVVFLENVKGLVFHNKGETLNRIIQSLEDIGYSVKYKVLNTCEYSELPQNRERVYIVCVLNKCNKFKFPEKVMNKPLPLTDILFKEVEDSFYYNQSKLYDTLKTAITKTGTFYQWRRRYVRENKSNVCPTLTANMGTGGHNVPLILDDKGIRKLTPRECARLQGFPDNFVLPHTLPLSVLYKHIGNSVSVPVVEQIARGILTFW